MDLLEEACSLLETPLKGVFDRLFRLFNSGGLDHFGSLMRQGFERDIVCLEERQPSVEGHVSLMVGEEDLVFVCHSLRILFGHLTHQPSLGIFFKISLLEIATIFLEETLIIHAVRLEMILSEDEIPEPPTESSASG